MSNRWLALGGALVLLSGTGCAMNKSSAGFPQRAQDHNVVPAAVALAPEEVPPKILPETYFAAGQLLEAQGQLAGAIGQYQRAISVHHKYVEAYQRLGRVLSQMDRHTDATAALLRATELRPDDPILHNDLGFEYALQQRWADAEASLGRALALKPGFARARVNLGMVLCEQRRYDEGWSAFAQALSPAEAHYNVGLILRRQHEYARAESAFQQALQQEPRFAAARAQLSQLRSQLHSLETLQADPTFEQTAPANEQYASQDDTTQPAPNPNVTEPARGEFADEWPVNPHQPQPTAAPSNTFNEPTPVATATEPPHQPTASKQQVAQRESTYAGPLDPGQPVPVFVSETDTQWATQSPAEVFWPLRSTEPAPIGTAAEFERLALEVGTELRCLELEQQARTAASLSAGTPNNDFTPRPPTAAEQELAWLAQDVARRLQRWERAYEQRQMYAFDPHAPAWRDLVRLADRVERDVQQSQLAAGDTTPRDQQGRRRGSLLSSTLVDEPNLGSWIQEVNENDLHEGVQPTDLFETIRQRPAVIPPDAD